jgi:hypothetical protein
VEFVSLTESRSTRSWKAKLPSKMFLGLGSFRAGRTGNVSVPDKINLRDCFDRTARCWLQYCVALFTRSAALAAKRDARQ